MKIKDNIHAGHRQRLREKILRDGIYNQSEINYLEYLLTFVIPRADTNPLAHALLDEFMTLDGVLSATATELKQVAGIGDKTADFLTTVGASEFLRKKSKISKNVRLINLGTIINFITSVMPPSRNEQFIVIHLGKNYSVKNYKLFKGTSHSYIDIDTKEITDFIVSHQTGFIMFAHTHPEHNAKPSASDYQIFEKLTTILNSFSCVLVDNLILGESDFYSYKFNILRKYSEIDIDYVKNHTLKTSEEACKNLQDTQPIEKNQEYIDF